MSVYGPLDLAPRIMQRSSHLVDLAVRNREGTDRYRLWGSKKVNDAYGDLDGADVSTEDPTLMLETLKDRVSQSPSVIKSGRMLDENRRGQTTFMFDMDDFLNLAGNPFNGDDFPVYVRVQEHRAGAWQEVQGAVNNGKPILGPILVIPPPKFYGAVTGSITISGNAPAGTDCDSGEPPVVDMSMQDPTPMHIIFPKPCTNMVITATDKDMLVSFGLFESMFLVEAGKSVSVSGRYKEIVLAAKEGAAFFELRATTGHVG